ncbi:MAG: relaxase/mobilization nuclease domain-containing protein [Pseudomonadota bacterium]
MILKGSQRGGAKDLAVHLMKDENDHVEVHELRGFVSGDLEGALHESYAISRGTKCRQFLYSLSLNPPKDADVSTDQFEAAIDKVEQNLGLSGQPRAIVFHEKEGRRHAHAVWSRINVDEMKAVQMSFDHRKLQTISKELYREHGWDMPRGLANASERDPLNFTLEEWQQAKRIGKDPKAVKAAFQDAWAISDSKAGLSHALAERGFHLAKGDRRGFVAVDAVTDEVFAVPRWAGVKTKDVRDRLGDENQLPSIAETRAMIAQGILPKLRGFDDQLSAQQAFTKQDFECKKADLVTRQRAERSALEQAQKLRAQTEAQTRQARFRKGLGGIWDRLRGEHKKIEARNMAEAQKASARDRAEKGRIVYQQLRARRLLANTRLKALQMPKEERAELQRDITRFEATRPPKRERRASDRLQESKTSGSTAEAFDKAARKRAFLDKRRSERAQRPRRPRGPSVDR